MRRCSPSVFKRFFISSPSSALVAVAGVLLLSGCQTTTKVTREVVSFIPFTGGKKEQPAEKGVKFKKGRLALTMKLAPQPVKLSDDRQINVTVQLENISKHFVQLEFPSTQRIEILVRDDKDKLVTQWSEDRAFETGITYVGINPGERLEYATNVSTRDLEAGKRYTILGFFPQYDTLRAEKTITPEP